jgi:hypothetical protein
VPAKVMEVHGLEEIQRDMQQYPKEMEAAMRATTEAALLVIWGNVPPYPPAPEGSTYRRTGTLGRSLGGGVDGGKGGQPDILEVKKLGAGLEGRFGTRLGYAPVVIGEEQQAEMHQGRWWTLAKVAESSVEKINLLYQKMADKLVAFLERKK